MTTRRRVAGIAVLLASVLLVAGMSGALAASTSEFEIARLATLAETTAQNKAVELRIKALDETLEVRRLMVAANTEIAEAEALSLHVGVLSQPALDALASAQEALVDAIPTDIRAIPAIPEPTAERSAWTALITAMRASVDGSGAELRSRLRNLDSAVILVAAASASGVDSTLAANPLASAESKALLSATGVRIEQGIEHGGELPRRIHDHVAAVKAVQASQAAAVAAAAALSSSAGGSRGSGGDRTHPYLPSPFQPTDPSNPPTVYFYDNFVGTCPYDSEYEQFTLGSGEEYDFWPDDPNAPYEADVLPGFGGDWILIIRYCI